MADESPGEGWWKASDGNWYPPSSVPPPPPPPPASSPSSAVPGWVPPAGQGATGPTSVDGEHDRGPAAPEGVVTTPADGNKRKQRLWAIGGAIAALVIIGVVLALVLGSSKRSATSAASRPSSGVNPTPTVAPTTPSTAAPTTTTSPPANALNPIGTAVSIPNTVSGIDKVTVSAWYPGVVDTSQFPNTPSAGHTWDAIVATTCAGPSGSSTGPAESDFEALLSNGSTASASYSAGGSQFGGPLASLSELNPNDNALAPGQCVTGWVVLSIPPNATPVAIQFSGTTASFSAPNSVVKWSVPGS